MAEILVKCHECGYELEEYDTEFKWKCLVICTLPCETCLGNKEADVRAELE
jgi:hypothetical protein